MTFALEDSVMGLLDQIGAAAGGATGTSQGSGGNAILTQQVMAMLSKPGALDNLLNGFRGGGLGNIAQSWIGTGPNQSVSPDQVRSAMGQGTITELAQRAGMGESETANALTSLLPQMIDKLTPDGKVPTQSNLEGIMGSLGRLAK
jgi:uncharacterized protein YidB (DUF937 family)